jgi:hypothetical protein
LGSSQFLKSWHRARNLGWAQCIHEIAVEWKTQRRRDAEERNDALFSLCVSATPFGFAQGPLDRLGTLSLSKRLSLSNGSVFSRFFKIEDAWFRLCRVDVGCWMFNPLLRIAMIDTDCLGSLTSTFK